jgi:HD-GYP domain-containing protein (c-di-GMP phosphodiesterase class II)
MAIAAWENTQLAGGYVAAGEEPRAEWARRKARGATRRAFERVPRAARMATIGAIVAGAAFVIATSNEAPIAVGGGALALLCSGVLLGWSLGADTRCELEREIDDRSHELWQALSELEVAQAETVRRLSMAVELRDEDTGAHIERIGRLSALLAEQIGMEPAFCSRLSHAAPLHDVGKVAIPDAILLKPGPLMPEERAIVETHAEEGHRLLRRSSSSILELAASVALSHHEKWDGTGYPRGLAREEIPIEGRIVAVTDVFDALTSDRVYRKAYPMDRAIALMREQRGRHFDPELLDAFMEVIGASGEHARAHIRSNPRALVAGLLEVFTKALEIGDAEMAEGAVLQAIEDGIAPALLHTSLLVPALRRIGELWEAGDIDAETEHNANAIVRRILATLYRYMIDGTEPTRERVLLAGVEGDRRTLELQMAHDQLAAAGFRTTLVTELSPERLADTIDNQTPEVLVLGGTGPLAGPAVKRLMAELASTRPELPVLLGGTAATAPHEHPHARELDRLERCVTLVEELLANDGPGHRPPWRIARSA